MKALLDTRFLALIFLASDEKSKKWSKATLENLQCEGNIGIVPSIVVHEFYKLVYQKWEKRWRILELTIFYNLTFQFSI
jgi:hypothetical protein